SLALPDRQLPLLRYALPEAEDLMNAWTQKDDKIPY
ncbi:MAG: tRNA-specific adenosine deaminase, partial [Gammaproteobacteria bacterium]|nr:tRNA-specific adenosine deaminase [Gammaproteobacteria bacterium]